MTTMPELEGVEHRYVDLPGLRMHVAEAGQGEPVVLLHGFPQHWWEWREVIPKLAEHHRVICPDLRGFGWTDAPAVGYPRGQLLADLVALLDSLEIERANLVGHDWGSLLAYQLSLTQPERVRAHLSLAGPPPFISIGPSFAKVMWRLWFDFVLVTPGLGPWSLRKGGLARFLLTSRTCGGMRKWSADDVEIFTAQFQDPARARAGAALYRSFILPEAMRMSRDFVDVGLSTTTRVLIGADDPIVRPEFVRGHESHVEDLTVDYIPNAAHFLVDDRPDEVVKHALNLFQK